MCRERVRARTSHGLAMLIAISSIAVASGMHPARAGSTPGTSSGSVLTLSGCSYEEVKQALEDAPIGATIEVGAGTCTWFDDATHPGLYRYGSVHLKGKGIGQTNIHVSTPECATQDDGELECDTKSLLVFKCFNDFADAAIELSGFSFFGDMPAQGWTSGVKIDACHDYRIHGNRFQEFKGDALTISRNVATTPPRGVVYENEFVDNVVTGVGYGVAVYNNDHWPALVLGDQNPDATVVEDNCFMDNRHSMAANRGAQYVFRYNTVINTPKVGAWPPVDAHGIQDAGQRGTRSWEIYRNILKFEGGNSEVAAIGIRGGDGVAWGNQIDASFPYSLMFRLEWYQTGLEQCVTEPGSPLPRAGKYPADWLGQTRNAWVWGNSWGNAAQTIGFAGCEYYFQENRDYFQRAPTAAELSGHAYQPFQYPHPLRGIDRLFVDGFESLVDRCALGASTARQTR